MSKRELTPPEGGICNPKTPLDCKAVGKELGSYTKMNPAIEGEVENEKKKKK
jgi:hypothetical protein